VRTALDLHKAGREPSSRSPQCCVLEEGGFDTQDDAIERLTQIYTEKKRTAPSVAEARRELGQKTVAEYAKQWRPGNAG
jgi:hypothetical protein